MLSVRAILVGTLLVALVAIASSATATCDTTTYNRRLVTGTTCKDCADDEPLTTKAGHYAPRGNQDTSCGCPAYQRNAGGSGDLGCGNCKPGFKTTIATTAVTLVDTSSQTNNAGNDQFLCAKCSNSELCIGNPTTTDGIHDSGNAATIYTCAAAANRLDNTDNTKTGVSCGACKAGKVKPGAGQLDSGADKCDNCGNGKLCRDAADPTKGVATEQACADVNREDKTTPDTLGMTCAGCKVGLAPATGETWAEGYKACIACPTGSMCREAVASPKGAPAVTCSSLNREATTQTGNEIGKNCGPCKIGFYYKKATGSGTNVLGGAEGYLACTACPAGKSTAATGKECLGDPDCGATEPDTLCSVTCTAATQYSNATTGLCTDCAPFNRLGNTPATGTCGSCTNDFFSTESSGISTCTACSSVHRASAAGSSCGPCLVGYYSASLTGISGCVSCASLNRTDSTTANTCSTCSLGFTGSNDTTTACISCSSLNRVNGPTAGCGVCSAGFVGPASTSVACVAEVSYNATCASQNRVPSNGAYPSCGVCIAGAAGVGNGTAACTVCSGNTYPAAGLTTCQSCVSAASATGPACTSCNTATGACLSCPPNSVPTNTTGCTYSCAVGTAPQPGTLTPCSSCLVSNCTSCANNNGVCLACPTGYTILPTPFAGCFQNAVSTGTGNSSSTNSTQSTNVATSTVDVLNTFANTAVPGTPTQVIYSGDSLAYIASVVNGSTTERNVTASVTINGRTFEVIITLAPSADGSGVTVVALVAYPPLFNGQQLSDLFVASVSVTVRATTTPTTTASKFRRLSASTMAVPGGSTITLPLTGAVGSGRVVYCARVAPGESAYFTYAPAIAAGSNQYTCTLNQPEGSTYALVTIPAPPVGSTGTQQVVPATYENSHTAVGLGVGLGVGIPVLAAILITIFCCINGGRPKAVAVPAPVYGYGVPAPAVTYASPY